jgi:nucleotide-binding universal stress UspA family protein
MRKPILVGFDPIGRDRAPVDFGLAMARVSGAPLIVATVQTAAPVLLISAGTSLQYGLGQVDVVRAADCDAAIAELAPELSASGIPFQCRQLTGTSAARLLHEEAVAEEAALVVAGAGRTVVSLMHGAPCPVAGVPAEWGAHGGLATIGIAYVDDDEARTALRDAHALARRAEARLRVITVVREPDDVVRAEESLRTAFAGLDIPVEIAVLSGDPADMVVRVSSGLDLLVCGSRGYGPLLATLLGSVSRRVVLEAHCPVIVVPRGVRTSLAELTADAPGATAPA